MVKFGERSTCPVVVTWGGGLEDMPPTSQQDLFLNSFKFCWGGGEGPLASF